MTEFSVAPDGYAVRIGHNLYDRNTGSFFKVIGKKTFDVKTAITMTASQAQLVVQLSDLKSSESEMYWLESVMLLNNVTFWMKYRDKDLFGTSSRTGLTMEEANRASPFNVNAWLYNFTPTAEVTELSAIAGSKYVRFAGVAIAVQRYNPNNDTDKKAIAEIQDGKLKCWEIRG